MSENELLKPGQKAPKSGQYVQVGPRGGDRGGVERTVVRGEPLPPTPEPNLRYRLTDPTRTQGKKRNR